MLAARLQNLPNAVEIVSNKATGVNGFFKKIETLSAAPARLGEPDISTTLICGKSWRTAVASWTPVK